MYSGSFTHIWSGSLKIKKQVLFAKMTEQDTQEKKNKNKNVRN